MRIWSIHPKYLDTKGLVALWRETLLAKNVLEGNTKGYKNHPQLERFKASGNALDCIHYYLQEVYNEAVTRGYKFDKSKFNNNVSPCLIKVTKGQMDYELRHLLNKLELRDPDKYHELKALGEIKAHSLFIIVEGEIEDWERI